MKIEQTNKQVIKMFNGLDSMGKRFLPLISSDLRVARYLKIIEPAAAPLISARAKIAGKVLEEAGIAEGEKITGLLAQSIMAKIVEAQRAFDEEVTEIEIPEKKLAQADLPKERTGENGWQNGAGLGEIVFDLGELFEMPKDE